MAVLGLTLAAMVQERAGLSPHETLVGIVMAMAVDSKTGRVRLKRETIQARTRLSLDQLKRALAGLVRKGVLEGKRTGRATIYEFRSTGKEDGRVDGALVHHQKVHGCTIAAHGAPMIQDGRGDGPRCLDEFKRERGARPRRKAVTR